MSESNAQMERIRGTIRSATTKLLNKIDGELCRRHLSHDVLEEYMDQLMRKEQCLIYYE